LNAGESCRGRIKEGGKKDQREKKIARRRLLVEEDGIEKKKQRMGYRYKWESFIPCIRKKERTKEGGRK